MKQKLNRERVDIILECAQNARPFGLWARLAGVDEETIRRWLRDGSEILQKNDRLFHGANGEEELLGYLAQEIDKCRARGESESWDKFLATGKKEHLIAMGIKNAAGQSPERALDIAFSVIQKMENSSPVNPQPSKFLTKEEREEIQKERGLK